MRLKKIAAAAVAMVMAMSMMAVPVFAATGSASVAGESKFDANDNTAHTDVLIVYTNEGGNLSVTVPMNLTFAVTSTGEIKYPSNYKIVNNSVVPVHVTNIAVSRSDADYTLGAEANGKVAKLSMTATAKDGKTDTVNFVADSPLGKNQNQKYGQTADTINVWNIGARESEAKGTELALTFPNSKIDPNAIKAAWANKAEYFCDITYTIAAGTTDTVRS